MLLFIGIWLKSEINRKLRYNLKELKLYFLILGLSRVERDFFGDKE